MVAFSRPLNVQDDLLDGVGLVGGGSDVIGVALARRSAAAYSAVDKAIHKKKACGPRGKKMKDSSPFSWEDHLKRLKVDATDAHFKRRYRLTPNAFTELLALVKSNLRKNDIKVKASRGRGSEPA